MSRDQAESSCAIQAKLDAILRNSTSQDRPAAERRKAIELTSWNHDGTNGSQHRYHYPGMPRVQHRGGGKAIMKSGTANTTSGPGDSTTHNNVGPDVMRRGQAPGK